MEQLGVHVNAAEFDAMIHEEVEKARAEAHAGSRREWADREMEKLSSEIKSKKINGVLREVQQGVKGMRRERMRKVEHFLCDHCDKVISHPSLGFVIQGNIYVADPSCKGGLVGNNFPTLEPGKTFSLEEVQQTVLCRDCFAEALLVRLEPLSPDSESNCVYDQSNQSCSQDSWTNDDIPF